MAAIVEPISAPAPTAEVTPKDGMAPPPAPEEATAPAEGTDLPDEVLRMPAIQALFAGSPPAISASLKDFQKRPEAKLIVANKDALMGHGIGLYRSLSGDLGVLFNQLKMNPQDLIAADKAGKLPEVAPPFDQVNEMVAKSGADNPVLATSQVPGGPAGAATPAVPQSAQMPKPASDAERKTAQARTQQALHNRPAQGPRPGGGRLLNSIMKPVI